MQQRMENQGQTYMRNETCLKTRVTCLVATQSGAEFKAFETFICVIFHLIFLGCGSLTAVNWNHRYWMNEWIWGPFCKCLCYWNHRYWMSGYGSLLCLYCCNFLAASMHHIYHGRLYWGCMCLIRMYVKVKLILQTDTRWQCSTFSGPMSNY